MPGKKDAPARRGDSNTSMTLKDFSKPGGKNRAPGKEGENGKSLLEKGKAAATVSSSASDNLPSEKSYSSSVGSSTGLGSGVSSTTHFSDKSTEGEMHLWLDLMREFGEGCKLLKRASDPVLPKVRNYLKEPKLEAQLNKLCYEAESVFRKEDRVIKLKSPTVIIGDIHGNLHDLLTLDRSFFSRKSPFLNHCFLFLGDYIDRGKCSLECMIFLLAMKVMYPKRFLLVRGNHEVSVVNRQYTFFNECRSKLAAFADSMYARFNKVFDCMPICAVVDGVIYCAHGGVPSAPDPSKPALLKDLDCTPCPLPHPEIGHRLAWEAMWNDPVEEDEFANLLATHKQTKGAELTPEMKAGFFPNFKRLTGHFYSPQATRKFLRVNKLSCVIRAHEHCQEGVTLKQGTMCYTVFTTSKYATDNHAGVIVIEDGRIRPQKINTEIYPAT